MIDASDMLGSGVYVLWHRGRVVCVAWAKNVLERVALHRQLKHQKAPSWFPTKPLSFDRVEYFPCPEHFAEGEVERVKMELRYDCAA